MVPRVCLVWSIITSMAMNMGMGIVITTSITAIAMNMGRKAVDVAPKF